ncbi:MAG TPA: NTP transferase domain-containing protein [Thermaerobacter sp.]
MVGAVILAGRRNEGRLRALFDGEYEAMLPVAGRPMVAWVMAACLEARAVGQVALVGPAEALADEELHGAASAGRLVCVPPGADLIDSVRRGVDALATREPRPERLLLVTGDCPLITGEILDRFVDRCPPDADLCYPIVRRDTMEARFPGAARTYVRLRDGEFTGGNALLVRSDCLPRILERARELYAARKQPWKLAVHFGPAVLWRVLTRRATVAELEARVSRIAALRGRAIETADAEIAMDVDKAVDHALAEAWLQQRAAATEGEGGPTWGS